MIAILREDGALVRSFPFEAEASLGFHSLFGFVAEGSVAERMRSRKLRGLPVETARWLCRFRVGAAAGSDSTLEALEGCQAVVMETGEWTLNTPAGQFRIRVGGDGGIAPRVTTTRDRDRAPAWIGAFATLALIAFLLLPSPESVSSPETHEDAAPVTIKMVRERTVTVPRFQATTAAVPSQIAPKNAEIRRAVAQNLGFLGMLGRKDLTKALGGMPSAIKDASPGAGAGGKEGSGGELLVGLGQGVKRTTVGNTGVAGLGGIGTKGRGGGGGGYGNTSVGSGEGRALSTVALSQDVVLEGGLDRSVIQATIAKYLSQVRACYEDGLRDQPGITGQVAVAFEISGAGSVSSSRVSRSSLGSAGVEQCISKRIMGWTFPKPLGGVAVKVNYPFMLRPAG